MLEATITDNSYQVTSAGPNPKPWNKSRRKIRPFFCNIMDIVLFLLHIRGLKPLLVFYFRVEKKFAGGKFREIPFGVDIISAGGKFRAKSKFAKIAKIYSTQNIGVIQYIKFNLIKMYIHSIVLRRVKTR